MEGSRESQKWAERAIAVDPAAPEPYVVLGNMAMVELRWNEARRDLRKALDLNPNYSDGHLMQAIYLMAMGQANESLKEIDLACDLDPLNLYTRWTRGNLLFLARRYEESLLALNEVLTLDPEYTWPHYTAARGQGALLHPPAHYCPLQFRQSGARCYTRFHANPDKSVDADRYPLFGCRGPEASFGHPRGGGSQSSQLVGLVKDKS